MNQDLLRWLASGLLLNLIPVVICLLNASVINAQTVQTVPILRLAAPTNSAQAKPASANQLKPDDSKRTEAAKPEVKPTETKSADEKKPDPAAERLAKINNMTFDRKPTSILKAWAQSSGVIQAKPGSNNVVNGLPGQEGENLAVSRLESIKSRLVLPNVAGTNVAAAENVADAAKTTEPKVDDPFDKELQELSTNVTLGRWPKVNELIKRMPPAEGVAAWRAIVKSLGAGQTLAMGIISLAKAGTSSTIPIDNSNNQSMSAMQRMMMMNMNQGFNPNDPEVMAMMRGQGANEQHLLSVNDFVSLIKSAPQPVEAKDREPMARLVVLVERQTDATGDLVRQLEQMVSQKEPKPVLNRADVAVVLCAANLAADAGLFLPALESPEAKADPALLNLIARHLLAKYNRLGTPELVNQAWLALQAVMALEVKTPEQSQAREDATRQAISLAPKVDRKLTQKWFEESFKGRPERGVALLTSLGETATTSLQSSIRLSEPRLQNMRMLKTAVEALLAVAPERADEWRESLTTLAAAWLAEAKVTKAYDRSSAPRIQRDIYGNVYYTSDEDSPAAPVANPNLPQALPAREMVKLAPQGDWLKRVDKGLHPNIHKALAEIYLKMGGDSDAFPHIEEVSGTEPELARELAEEFLRVWTVNHDMNQAKNQRNPYIFIFGFEQKAESIPLTRSKQERNLEELSAWLVRLKKLPIRPIDESLVAKAFTTCHSSAEVYRTEAITAVFGPMENLRPETIARLAQQMRMNLAGLWRRPAVQDQAKTKRKEKDIRDEVLRGYATALKVVGEARAKFPSEWSLTSAQAALIHDENNFRQEISLSPDFMPVRRKALSLFAEAAGQYAAVVGVLPADRHTNDVFDQWFNAGLGACEPGQITESTLPETNQPALIRAAFANLPGAAAESHLNRFANQLFTRMSALAPAVKFRYLKAGFEIVGDASQAYEARKVYDYYKDLNREIQLEAVVDGPTSIEPSQPFGVYVNIRHTREIERESGGFGRYLQNQNQGASFYYNYGRPLENYRDKFQDAATKALQEHFEVLSVTFQTEQVTSLPLPEMGWRVTPYAYLLLKAKSPKVDRIPSIRLDLDFMDTSGYVILPVESPRVAVNCSGEKTSSRPFRDVKMTQILDERQSADRKLILEIKSTGHGLVPPVEELIDFNSVPSFVVEKIDDQGLSVSRFDEESSAAGIISERSSLVTLKAAGGLNALPETLHFPKPKTDLVKVTYQKYVDADLADAEPVTTLLARYGTVDRSGQYFTIAAVLSSLIVAGIALPRIFRSVAPVKLETLTEIPAEPFAVLGFLRSIDQENRLSQSEKNELTEAIRLVEESFFSAFTSERVDLPNLGNLLERWSRIKS